MKARLKFCLLAVLACASVLASFALGQWQLARAAQKQALQAAMTATAALPVLDERALVGVPEPQRLVYRSVRLRGQWLAQHTVYLDNRQMKAKAGLYVFTPLKLQDTGAVVVVQRGWVARNFIDRGQLPPLATPPGWVELVGHMAPPPSKLYELGQSDIARIRQNLDMTRYAAEVGQPLLALTVVQMDAASEGLLRDWPKLASGVEKHYGYAFQWFALSALIALLFVWFQIVKRFFRP